MIDGSLNYYKIEFYRVKKKEQEGAVHVVDIIIVIVVAGPEQVVVGITILIP